MTRATSFHVRPRRKPQPKDQPGLIVPNVGDVRKDMGLTLSYFGSQGLHAPAHIRNLYGEVSDLVPNARRVGHTR